MSYYSADGSLIDHERSACLADVGAAGYLAAVCITPTGDDVLWLVCCKELHNERPAHGEPDQPHEKLGRLPGNVRDRVWGDAILCGHPRRNGLLCRHRVKEPGQACGFHSARAAK